METIFVGWVKKIKAIQIKNKIHISNFHSIHVIILKENINDDEYSEPEYTWNRWQGKKPIKWKKKYNIMKYKVLASFEYWFNGSKRNK